MLDSRTSSFSAVTRYSVYILEMIWVYKTDTWSVYFNFQRSFRFRDKTRTDARYNVLLFFPRFIEARSWRALIGGRKFPIKSHVYRVPRTISSRDAGDGNERPVSRKTGYAIEKIKRQVQYLCFRMRRRRCLELLNAQFNRPIYRATLSNMFFWLTKKIESKLITSRNY